MRELMAALSDAAVSFRALVSRLADHVGRHHIPVNDHASDIHELLGADAVHHDLIRRVIRRIYKANRCAHLDALIYPAPTFTVLGQIRSELAASTRTDVDQINLVDEIGWATRGIFGLHPTIQADPLLSATRSEVIALDRHR